MNLKSFIYLLPLGIFSSATLAVAGTPSLSILTPPQTIGLAQCSSIVTVGITNSAGALVNATNTTVFTPSGSNLKIFRDSTCTAPVTIYDFPAGVGKASFYFKPMGSSTGQVKLTVTPSAASKLGATGQMVNIVQGKPSVLESTLLATSVPAGQGFGMQYKFVAEPLASNDMIHVEFVNGSSVIFNDNFQPSQNTTTWSGSVSYNHFVSVPITAPPGTYQIVAYIADSNGNRVTMNPVSPAKLAAATLGANAYQIGSITVTPSTVVADPSIVIPTQALGAGYSHVVFSDHFNSASSVSAGSTSANWYTDGYYQSSAFPASDYSLANGLLTILSDLSGYSDDLDTVDSKHNSQAWQHAYFEASISFDPNGSQGGAWPAFWSWPVEDVLKYDVTSAGVRGPYAEVDFMEAYPQATNEGAITYITTIHKHIGGGSVAQNGNNDPTIPSGTNFKQFHTYGCLWTPNKLVWYFDNQLVTTVLTGPTTLFNSVETEHMFLILGTGASWPMNVQYVHVFQ